MKMEKMQRLQKVVHIATDQYKKPLKMEEDGHGAILVGNGWSIKAQHD